MAQRLRKPEYQIYGKRDNVEHTGLEHTFTVMSVAAEKHNLKVRDIGLLMFLYPTEFFTKEYIRSRFNAPRKYVIDSTALLFKAKLIKHYGITGKATEMWNEDGTEILSVQQRFKVTAKGRKIVDGIYNDLRASHPHKVAVGCKEALDNRPNMMAFRPQVKLSKDTMEDFLERDEYVKNQVPRWHKKD